MNDAVKSARHRDEIDAAWASHDAMRAAVEDFRDAATDYLSFSAVPDLPAEARLLDLARVAAEHLAVPFETATDQDAAHREYEQLKAEVRRLQAVEREALRVLGAVIYYGCGGQLDLSDAALHDDCGVARTADPAGATVRPTSRTSWSTT